MKLHTDNPDTMPITDAVYGRPKFQKLGRKAYQARENRTPVWRACDPAVLTVLARRYPKLRRLAAQRRDDA